MSSIFAESVPKHGAPHAETAHGHVWFLPSEEQSPHHGHLDHVSQGTEAGEASGQTVRCGRPGMGTSVVPPPPQSTFCSLPCKHTLLSVECLFTGFYLI